MIPGTYGDNLSFLARDERIEVVELLFFLYDAETRDLLLREFPAIEEYAGRFAYTVHLPDRLRSEHEELVARFVPLAERFIVHPCEGERETDALAALLAGWEARYDPGPALGRFLLENTQGGRLEALRARLPRMGLCMDTGHLLLEGRSPAAWFDAHADLIAEIHLHGTDAAAAAGDGRLVDHRALRPGDPWLAELVPRLRSFSGIVNLEVFSWEEAEGSLSTLGGLLS